MTARMHTEVHVHAHCDTMRLLIDPQLVATSRFVNTASRLVHTTSRLGRTSYSLYNTTTKELLAGYDIVLCFV